MRLSAILFVACLGLSACGTDLTDLTETPAAEEDELSACSHSICTAGAKLKSSCDPCAAQICAVDSYCCTKKWNRICVDEVSSVCGLSTCSCTPACQQKQCGNDGCGGSCGKCSDGQTCDSSGHCTCTPKCEDRTCGNDGCGGSCGLCADGQTCSLSGQCRTPSCEGRKCGDDGSGGSCGECDDGQTCNSMGQCVCTPNCEGKQCGDDGCGGSCGTCPGDQCTGAYPPYSGTPDGYSDLENLRDSSLLSALQRLVKANHHPIGYSAAKRALFGAAGIDVHGGNIECIYSGDLFTSSQLDGAFNTEHSWPQSDFGSEASSAKGDMHHLFPTGKTINSCRSSTRYGDTAALDGKCSKNGSGRGPGVTTGRNVFMVRPAGRGDIARAHFYFSVRYHQQIPDEEEAALRCWHMQDPPDDTERARNDAIEARQGNRNPFIDRPEFVGYVSNF